MLAPRSCDVTLIQTKLPMSAAAITYTSLSHIATSTQLHYPFSRMPYGSLVLFDSIVSLLLAYFLVA